MKIKMMKSKIIIGTRGSKLALWQAEWVKSELQKLYSWIEIEIKKIKTTGDKILDVPLAKVGGKGLFVKEIEEALLRGEIDLAVHSMKDVPTEFPDGLELSAICKREDPRDAFVSRVVKDAPLYKDIKDLSSGAVIGTSSLRRASQLRSKKTGLKIVSLRGNVETRLKKLDNGEVDALILAAAGMKRLGIENRITKVISHEIILPAIGQGAIGIETRVQDGYIKDLLKPINHKESFICVNAERTFLKKLGGSCQVPIAAYARLKDNNKIIMDALVSNISGNKIIKVSKEFFQEEAETMAIALANEILQKGAKQILQDLYNSNYER